MQIGCDYSRRDISNGKPRDAATDVSERSFYVEAAHSINMEESRVRVTSEWGRICALSLKDFEEVSMKEMLSNKILTGLPAEDFARLLPLLEPVSLSLEERLASIGEVAQFVYFPESSILTCHSDMQDGKSVEVGMIGKDGMTGLSVVFGSRRAIHSLNVSIPGSALRMSVHDFQQEIEHSPALRRLTLDYVGEYIAQVSQRSACGILHRTEQRLAVWLLMTTDRLGTNNVETTQERIAEHLGVRRAGITVIVGELQNRGIIAISRGNLRILDRGALEACACECYHSLNEVRKQTSPP
jgi:CRP-like cAMP-binding protein